MAFDFEGFQAVLEQQQKLEDEKATFRAAALENVKQLVQTFNFTAAEIGVCAEGVAPKKEKRTIAPKYRAPSGETWTGRGRQPKFIVEAINAGHTLESMLIKD